MKKKNLLTLILLVLIMGEITAQNEFGAVGSYWNYYHEHHSGNGSGWDMIKVEKDTMINGETHKLLSRTYSRTEFFPENTTINNSYIYGTMQIKNDSVFVNNDLILDFGMETGDTLILAPEEGRQIKLVADSVTIESINGADHKKWYLQKICFWEDEKYSQDYAEVIEGIGQVGGEYLFWNHDGCVVLGGGTNGFSCYRNGSFEYPEMVVCDQLSSNYDLEIDGVDMYPNPVTDLLYLSSEEMIVSELRVFDTKASVVLSKANLNVSTFDLDVSDLTPGLYYIELQFDRREKKFIKMFVKE